MKDMLKTSVAAAALMAFAAPGMAAENVSTGMQKVKLKFYGQVNKAVMYGDDGHNYSRVSVVDWNVRPTWFGVMAEAPVSANVALGARIELEYKSNDSPANNNLSGDGDFNQGDTTWLERIGQVTIAHKQFGKVTLGQGPTASDTSAEADISGTEEPLGSLAAWRNLAGYTFIQSGSPSTGTGTTTGAATVGAAFNHLDGLNRNDRIRYDTPVFAGFSMGTSFVSGGAADVAAQYSGKIAGFQILARAAYANMNSVTSTNNPNTDDLYTGSASVLHDTGISATVSGGKRRYKTVSGVKRHSSDYVNGKLGYTAKIFASGPTSFGVEYGTYDEMAADNTDSTTWAVGAQHNFKDIGADAYIAYRNYSFDRTGTSYEDMKSFVTGLIVRF